jgi:hypothetical protein
LLVPAVVFEIGLILQEIGSREINHPSVRPALKSIFLPNSLTILRAKLFWDFSFLEVVLFETGAQLDSIQSHVFRHATFQQITIPGPMVCIGWASFWMCAQLQSVDLSCLLA